MKQTFFLVFFVAGMLLTSCIPQGESHFTPTVVLSAPICSHIEKAEKDTLSHKITEKGVYALDTVHIGDTISFEVLLQSYANTLVSFETKHDTMAIRFQIDSIAKIEEALLESSAPSKGTLYFKPSYNYAHFPMYYIPQQAGKQEFSVTVTSDSKYPTSTLEFEQVIEALED